MYKVVNCDENCIMTVVDTNGEDSRKYYADMNIGDIVGVDDKGKQYYLTVNNPVWSDVRFAANMCQMIDNDRVYHSVCDLYVLDFINYMRWNLHLNNIHEVIKIFSSYFNLIESYSKVLSSTGINSIMIKKLYMNSIYYGVQYLYETKQDLETTLPRYIKDVIYICNNKKYIGEYCRCLDTYVRSIRKAHALRTFISKIKQFNNVNRGNVAYNVCMSICLELIDKYKDKYMKFYFDIMRTPYVAEMYIKLNDVCGQGIKVLTDYVDNCEQNNIIPRVSEKIIKDLVNDKLNIYTKEKKKLNKGIAASAEKYEWIEKFEYAGYAAYVMKSLDDFKEEAEHQNNCVARCGYDERMAKGEIVICSLRKDDDWITCEINDGKIEQMFGKNNSDVDEDIKETFQEFLNNRF